jgi:hypothetical protein
MLKSLQRRNRSFIKPHKLHTSVYLLPRHVAHLQFLMNATGQSMNHCICSMIDQSIRSYKIKAGMPEKEKV